MDKTLTRQLYIMRALHIATFGYCFAIPVMVLYITDLFGKPEYYFYLAVLQAFIAFTFGIPLGKLADKYGRKPALIIGLATSSISWFVFFYAPTLPLITAAFALRGVGEILLSTSSAAYLFDLLQSHNKTKAYKKEEAKKSSYGIIIITVLTLAAGLVYQINPGLPFLLNSLFCLLMLFFVIFGLPDIKPHAKSISLPLGDKKTSVAKKIFSLEKPLIWLVLSHASWFGVIVFVIFGYQAHLQDLGAGSVIIATAISAVYISRAAGAWLVGRDWHEHHIGIAALIAIGLIALSAFSSSIWLVVFLLLLSSLAREFITTSLRTLLTTKSPAQYRSMVKGTSVMYGSVISMGQNALAGVMVTIWYGQGVLLMQAGLLAIVFGGCWFMYRSRSRRDLKLTNQPTPAIFPDQ